MTPIATVYQTTDGNYGIMSNCATPLGLARVLAALIPNLLEQAANQPQPAVIPSFSAGDPVPVEPPVPPADGDPLADSDAGKWRPNQT